MYLSYYIEEVKIVPGYMLDPNWKNDMYVIQTNKGVFIDNLSKNRGHEWIREKGHSVYASTNKGSNDWNWLKFVSPLGKNVPIVKNSGTSPVSIPLETKEALPSDYDISQNPELKQTYEYIEQGVPVIFLTGGAGTGKSTFIKYLKNNLKSDLNKNCIVLAPTGVAAINVSGQTIHKFFNFPFDPFENNPNLTKNPVIEHTDLIISDEVSMVRSCMIDHINYTLQHWCDKNKLFGGKQLLLIGDCFQLPPVKSEDDTNKSKEEREALKKYFDQWSSPYFFDAKCLRDLNEKEFKAIQLKKIYRQNDESFIHLLNRVRQKKDGYLNDINFLNDKCFIETRLKTNTVPEECLLVATTNAIADRYNNEKLDNLIQKGNKYNAYMASITGDSSSFESNGFLTPAKLELCIGAKIMVTKNITEHGLVNGDMGTVIYFGGSGHEETDFVDIKVKNTVYRLKRETWQSFKYKWDESEKKIVQEITGTFKQIPLKLGWAVTIHKSQGLTLDKIAIDAPNAWEPGQIYVALSRAKTLGGILLCHKLSSDSVKVDDVVVQRYRKFFPVTEEDKSTYSRDFVLSNEGFTIKKEKTYVEIGGHRFNLYKNELIGQKIGKHAENTISQLLYYNLIPKEEMEKLLNDEDYCYRTFGTGRNFGTYIAKFPMLSKERNEDNKLRYYKTRYKGYYICSQWYDSNAYKLARWLRKLAEGKLNNPEEVKDIPTNNERIVPQTITISSKLRTPVSGTESYCNNFARIGKRSSNIIINGCQQFEIDSEKWLALNEGMENKEMPEVGREVKMAVTEYSTDRFGKKIIKSWSWCYC